MSAELGPSARALLDAARAGMSPSPAAITRMRANVAVATGAGAASGAIAVKLGLVGLVGAVAIGALISRHSRASSEPLAIDLAAQSSIADSTRVVPADVAAPPVPAPVAPGSKISMIPPVPRFRRIEPTATHASATVPISLPREVALVDRARKALRTGKPAAALTAIEVYVRETKGIGQLAEDAAAYEIEALCQLRDVRAADKLDAFDRRFPRSANRSRLSARCW